MLRVCPMPSKRFLAFSFSAVILLVLAFNNQIVFLCENYTQSSTQPNIVQQDLFSTGRLPDSLTKLYDEVETFIMFIGQPRSGHSLVGAILDAHPEIIVPHEYDLIQKWDTFENSRLKEFGVQKYLLFHKLHTLSTFQAMFGIRASTPVYLNGHIYSYNISGGWQGAHNGKLKVIGDKKGGATSDALKDTSKLKILEEIQKTAGIPLKFIHVIRNPFDNIATQMLRRLGARTKVRDGKTKIDETDVLNREINDHFGRIEANERVRQLYGDAVLDILSHELLQNPKEMINKLCRFFGVTCYEDYLSVVEKLLHGKPSITRNTVVWTQDQKDWVHREIKKYSFLQSFTFEEEF